MAKRVPGTCILSILLLLILFKLASAGSPKTEALEQKIYEISSLRVTIIDKIDQSVEMRTRLEHHLAELRDEIRSEKIRTGIYSHQEAMQNLRIRYNLSLIQVLQAYIRRLNERIAFFQTGNERLKFLVYQIKDDIAVINTLKDMGIDNLIDRINRVLDEFIPETKKQIFNAADIRILPSEHVWEQMSIESRLN
jgi:uncharacterized phage infection (PIP) family protein YhgE